MLKAAILICLVVYLSAFKFQNSEKTQNGYYFQKNEYFQKNNEYFQNDNKYFQKDNNHFQNDNKYFQKDDNHFQNDNKYFQKDNHFQTDNKNNDCPYCTDDNPTGYDNSDCTDDNPTCPIDNSPNSIPYHVSRLPKSLIPEHYALKIKTYLNEENSGFKFYGEETITFKVVRDTTNITLHAKNLEIDESKIAIRAGENCIEQKVSSQRVEIVPQYDFYVIHLTQALIKNNTYKLELVFEGELTDSLRGYYRSSYIRPKTTTTQWLTVTQFQPISAREAFPCFDEPLLKAQFEVTIGHSQKYVALSNMQLVCSDAMIDNKNWVWDRFEVSKRMSTYTLAYTVHNFEYLETKVKGNRKLTIRTWFRPGSKSQAVYAHEITPRLLEFYEKQFQIPYPLSKLDQVAIPDFSAGAMENWGLIFYRESDLLYSKTSSSIGNKYRIASVISHELAHQWFGNLVTMKWWNDLWLNEGFATYIASLGVAYLHPEWNSRPEDSVNNIINIFRHDGMNSSHQVSALVDDPNKMSFMFDEISYSKGSSILRMLNSVLGAKTFLDGIRLYLKKYAYSNTDQNNLWNAMTEAAHKLKTLPQHVTVKQIMDTWTLQSGYPIITVTRNYMSGSATVVQRHYTYNTNKTEERCWWVALTYTSANKKNFKSLEVQQWLECRRNKAVPLQIKNIATSSEWVIFNIQLSGLYKVNYDYRNWDLLIDVLTSRNFQVIHVTNRAQLITDALDLAWTGDVDYKYVVKILQYLKQEKEYLPWKVAMYNLIPIYRILSLTSKYGYIINYMKSILTPVYKAVSSLHTTVSKVESDKLSKTKLMMLITNWSCRFGVGDCIVKCEQLFYKWIKSNNPDENNPIPVDLRAVVYCTTIRNGGEDVWKFLFERYTRSNVPTERETILASLACTREVWLLVRYLEWCFDGKQRIRKQDSFLIFSSIARTDVGFCVAREYLFQNFEAIYEFYSHEASKISKLIQIIAERMYSSEHIATMRQFTVKYKRLLTKVSEGVSRAFEKITINSQWMETHYQNITYHLEQVQSTTTTFN